MSRQMYANALKHAAKEAGVSADKARSIVERLFEIAAEGVKYEGRFSIPRVGAFIATKRAARRIRNPITRELMMLPLTKSVRFRPAKRGVFTGGAR